MLSTLLLGTWLALPQTEIAVSPIIPVRLTCKQVSSCEEAVEIWCNGYRGADRDDDGIPCENVCHSLQQVETIKARQGC